MPYKLIHIDLETVPSGNIDEFEVKVPGTFKNEDKIKAYKEDKNIRIEQFSKRALNTNTADIVAISFAVNDEPIISLLADPTKEVTEYDVLSYLEEYLEKERNSNEENGNILYDIYFCGFNIREYDLRILLKKALKYKLYNLSKMIPFSKYDKRVIDMLEIWNGSSTLDPKGGSKLKDIREYLGLEGKTYGMDGSMVYEYYLNGRFEDISKYCDSDVSEERELFHILKKGVNLGV